MYWSTAGKIWTKYSTPRRGGWNICSNLTGRRPVYRNEELFYRASTYSTHHLPFIKLSKISCEILAAKIDGGYCNYCNLLKEKFDTPDQKLNGNKIILDSYDRALHNRTKNGRSSIVSFSSSMVSNQILRRPGITAGGSLNILTWQQYLGDEKAQYLFLAL